MRKDYGTRTKMKDGGKLKMVTNKEGKKVPFFAADGKGKMAMGGRVKKMGGGMMKKRSMLKAGSNGNGKKKAFGMLSVKAGIDKNPMPTQADRIAGAKMKNKKGKA